MMNVGLPSGKDCFYPAYLAIFKPYLDAVRVHRRVGQDVLYHAFGHFARTLVFLEDNVDECPRLHVASFGWVHG